MSNKYATSGNSGPKVRSDCEIILELRNEGGIKVDLKSKVESLYGRSIRQQCIDIMHFFGIKDAIVRIEDSGALPFVISARIESAVKKLLDTRLEYLPEFAEGNKYSTLPDRIRFSRLYIPGNTPGLMINAGIYSADGIILDLEDSVSPEKKDEARILVRNALRQLYFNSSERMVRINQGDMGILDLEVIIPQNVNMVLLPKSEDPGYIRDIDKRITEIKNRSDIFNPVYLMPIIETALGVEMAFEIARASDSVVAVAVGLEDLTADLGVERTPEGKETLYARARVINAARAAGIQPTDSVFPDKDDLEALRKYALISNSLGFEGMGCIHPRQISVVKQVFAPGPEEITRSGRIVLAFDDARSKGLSVVSLGSKMIDPPVVARAMKNIELAVKMNLLPADWKNQHLIE